jgi:hypothetical protein
MACISHQLRDAGPLVQLILRIPTMFWSVQAALGIPDEIGLFSPPGLPFCQIIELAILVFMHGMIIFVYASVKCNQIHEKIPRSAEFSRYWMAGAVVTVIVWFDVMMVSLLQLIQGVRNNNNVLMVVCQIRGFESEACVQDNLIQ